MGAGPECEPDLGERIGDQCRGRDHAGAETGIERLARAAIDQGRDRATTASPPGEIAGGCGERRITQRYDARVGGGSRSVADSDLPITRPKRMEVASGVDQTA